MAEKPNSKSNKDILDALGVEAEPVKKAAHSPREERIIAGFEEIQRFVEKNGRAPAHGEDNDIFERLYATRMDQIRSPSECLDLVQVLDHQGLLVAVNRITEPPADYNSDQELLEELGVEPPKDGDIGDYTYDVESVSLIPVKG